MKQKHNFEPISAQVSQILKPIFAKKKDNFVVINNLQKNWQKIVGAQCFQFCSLKKIQFEKNKESGKKSGKKAGASLYIKAYNSAVAFYLEANSNQIIQNIASYYGYKIVSQIKIIQEPKNIDLVQKVVEASKISTQQQKIIEDSTSKISDKELKLVLQNLGKAIFSTPSSRRRPGSS